jgi:hypothetical protein
VDPDAASLDHGGEIQGSFAALRMTTSLIKMKGYFEDAFRMTTSLVKMKFCFNDALRMTAFEEMLV